MFIKKKYIYSSLSADLPHRSAHQRPSLSFLDPNVGRYLFPKLLVCLSVPLPKASKSACLATSLPASLSIYMFVCLSAC